jgi:two-component system, NtrC family, response regulator AtoC
VIQRAVIMNDGIDLEVAHLPAELVAGAVDPIAPDLGRPGVALPTLDEIEVRYMRQILALTGNNKVRAAEHLGITRQTLTKRLGDAE